MADRYFYDEDGKYRGKFSDRPPVTIVGVFITICILVGLFNGFQAGFTLAAIGIAMYGGIWLFARLMQYGFRKIGDNIDQKRLTKQTEKRNKEIEEVMQTWIGFHQSDLIQSWGAPLRVVADGLGGNIVVYHGGAHNHIYSEFYTDNQGVIRNVKWKDN
jgi:hypothetical protein